MSGAPGSRNREKRAEKRGQPSSRVAERSEYAGSRIKLRAELDQWMKETGGPPSNRTA